MSSDNDNRVQLLGAVLITLCIILLWCWYNSGKDNMKSTKNIHMPYKVHGEHRIDYKKHRHNNKPKSMNELRTKSKKVKKSNKVQSLKWKSDGLIGDNLYEGLVTRKDGKIIESNKKKTNVTLPPEIITKKFAPTQKVSVPIGAVQLKNTEQSNNCDKNLPRYHSNKMYIEDVNNYKFEPSYGDSRGYVSI